MHPAEVVVGEMKRHGGFEVVELFLEGVWLAVAPKGATLQFGVIAKTKGETREKFMHSLR